jgi:hypothetical protein
MQVQQLFAELLISVLEKFWYKVSDFYLISAQTNKLYHHG